MGVFFACIPGIIQSALSQSGRVLCFYSRNYTVSIILKWACSLLVFQELYSQHYPKVGVFFACIPGIIQSALSKSGRVLCFYSRTYTVSIIPKWACSLLLFQDLYSQHYPKVGVFFASIPGIIQSALSQSGRVLCFYSRNYTVSIIPKWACSLLLFRTSLTSTWSLMPITKGWNAYEY